MLATCLRKGELIRAEVQDLNLEEGTWTIPHEHSKNNKAIVISTGAGEAFSRPGQDNDRLGADQSRRVEVVHDRAESLHRSE
jgi:integrase